MFGTKPAIGQATMQLLLEQREQMGFVCSWYIAQVQHTWGQKKLTGT